MSLDATIERLSEYARASGDLQAEAWLDAIIESAYDVIDSWEFGNLAEAVTDLGSYLPVRGE